MGKLVVILLLLLAAVAMFSVFGPVAVDALTGPEGPVYEVEIYWDSGYISRFPSPVGCDYDKLGIPKSRVDDCKVYVINP